MNYLISVLWHLIISDELLQKGFGWTVPYKLNLYLRICDANPDFLCHLQDKVCQEEGSRTAEARLEEGRCVPLPILSRSLDAFTCIKLFCNNKLE